ncbi:MAG: flippase-like domain-containing protein, partial [Candidatus Omnitrophica bacterium]|nr:flippase-like domain-containing protein [Candidatus Omnitrophota bacterium]
NKKVFVLVNKIARFKLLKTYLEKIHNSCYSFRTKRKVMFWAILLSLVIQGGFSVVFYFTGMSLGINLNIVYYLALVAIISIVTFLPISIGGLGLRDNAAVILFSAFGVTADRIAAMTLLVFFYVFFIGAMGGIIYAFALCHRRK